MAIRFALLALAAAHRTVQVDEHPLIKTLPLEEPTRPCLNRACRTTRRVERDSRSMRSGHETPAREFACHRPPATSSSAPVT